MKLNINARELLALYNVLYERFEAGGVRCDDDEELKPSSTDDQLRQLYNRIKACLVTSLSTKMVDPLDNWLEGQRRKIGQLEEQNGAVAEQARQLAADKKVVVMSAGDDEADVHHAYPRRAPNPIIPKGGRFRGHRQ